MIRMGPITAVDPVKEARAVEAVRHALELLSGGAGIDELSHARAERIDNERRLTLEMFAGWRGDALPTRVAS